MGEMNYWNVPNLRSVIIPISVVTGQTTYPLDSKVTNLNEAVAIVGLSHRAAAANARTVNSRDEASDMVDTTIVDGAILYLNTKDGSNRQQLALANLTPKQADNWMYRIPADKTIDLVNGKSKIVLTASSANVTANNGKVIELEVFYIGDC